MVGGAGSGAHEPMTLPRELPPNAVKYAETPIFNSGTAPNKLTGTHDTKPGVWGKLVVLSGALDYVVLNEPTERIRVAAGEYAIIEPTVPHRVALIGPVTFKVEFHRLTA